MKKYIFHSFLFLLSIPGIVYANHSVGDFENDTNESIYVEQLDGNLHGGNLDIFLNDKLYCRIIESGQYCVLSPQTYYSVHWTTSGDESYDCLAFLTNPTESGVSLLPPHFFLHQDERGKECNDAVGSMAAALDANGQEIGFLHDNSFEGFEYNPQQPSPGVAVDYNKAHPNSVSFFGH